MEAVAEDLNFNYVNKLFKLPDYKTHSEPAHNLEDDQLQNFIDVIDDNIGDLYVKNRGPDWKDDKEEEMTEPGLIFVWFTDDNDELVGYLSFKICIDDDDIFVVYLFEIHLTENFQGKKIGQQLIDQFHEFAKLLHNSSHNLYKNVTATALTVFSENERALNWYKKLNYELTGGSPVDRKLRNGKIVKPEYYLMRRSL
ncbi:hypothetical protein G210_1162 [Candida maltosa Xu316]|uniref:N-alpha-acetyltransferase 40 n=1 Tax=Candida maltosa (strain Xu316) TaxID=1245528 RepID=M3HLH9_CANMX|nr:hypothetical protein G210_1162 [Candida maltosa Xu316]